MIRSVSAISKSSTNDPSRRSACARTPAPPRASWSGRSAGSSRCSALAKAGFLAERQTSPIPVPPCFAAKRNRPGQVSDSNASRSDTSRQR